MTNIFVTIVNFNGNKDTLSCLKSLEKIKIKDFELNVIVIDNGSKEIFKEDPKNYKNFKLHILRSEENLGFSGGQNLGIKYALVNNADYVMVLNNDVEVDEDLIVNLLETFNEKKDCGIVSPKIYFAKGHEYHKDRYEEKDRGKVIWYAGGKIDWKNMLAFHKGVDEVDNKKFNELEKTDFASGCCALIKSDVFNNVGLFDEKYFLYFEDNDLCQRARSKGFESYYQPKAFLWHINAGSAGGSGSELQDYYITRNRLLFGFKYAPVRSKIALHKEGFKLIVSGRKWQKIGVEDYFLRKFGKGSYK
jgi:GT2 family glycosyltransferase